MENKSSCPMVRCDSDEAVEQGAPGSFFIDTLENGQRIMWHKLPDGNYGCLYLRPVIDKTRTGPSWQWDGNEESPTLTPSVHLPGRWHGFFIKGRMASQK